MICNKILQIKIIIYSASLCIYMYMIIFFRFLSEWWFNLPAQLPMTIDDWWLMYELALVTWIPMHGANLTCWLCLINCRFDNANIIWHYSREKITVFTVALSKKKRAFVRFEVPEIIFVVFDVTSSPHPSNLLLLSIFLTVYQWLHSIIVKTIRLKLKYNNI